MQTERVVKKAQQRLYFLRKLKKAGMGPKVLRAFYRGTTESILTGCFTAWYGGCTDLNRKALQRVVRTAERIRESSHHPNHSLFKMLPHGKRLRSLKAQQTAKNLLSTNNQAHEQTVKDENGPELADPLG